VETAIIDRSLDAHEGERANRRREDETDDDSLHDEAAVHENLP
jgi:hypothetical protein